jgi:tellurite methyltransferase
LPPQRRYEDIDGQELYRRLAVGKPVVILDVRTEPEFEQTHIPGSLLVPLQDLEGRIGEIPNSGTPIAVICQKGQRSSSACQFLAEHGYGPMLKVAGGLDCWPGPLTSGTDTGNRYANRISPSSFLIKSFPHLPRGLALDVAMGDGRNAIYLATRGFDVDGVDANPEAVARARTAARRIGAPIRAITGDFEDGTYIIPLDTYSVITVFNYLHRPLFKDIREGLIPGGVVVYQTYTRDQVRFGSPRNPDFLMRDGELREAFAGWEVLSYREFSGRSRATGKLRSIAGIVARKPE